MQCPYCGKEMEQGYFQSRDGIGWSKHLSPVAAFSCLCAKIVLGKVVVAHHCDGCKKIVISYD